MIEEDFSMDHGDMPTPRKNKNSPYFGKPKPLPPSPPFTRLNSSEDDIKMWKKHEKRFLRYIAYGKFPITVASKPTLSPVEKSPAILLELSHQLQFASVQLLSLKDEDAFSYLVLTIQNILIQIAELGASGNSKAVCASHEIAYQQICRLRYITSKQLSSVQKIASFHHEWPDFISPHSDTKKKAEERIKKIKLGTKSPQRLFGKKPWSAMKSDGQEFRHILHLYIERLYNTILIIRKELPSSNFFEDTKSPPPLWIERAVKLPPFSLQTRSDYWKLCKDVLVEAMTAYPDRFDDLRKVGEFRKRAWLNNMNATEKQQACQANVAIFERLKEAFDRRFSFPDV